MIQYHLDKIVTQKVKNISNELTNPFAQKCTLYVFFFIENKNKNVH